MRKFNYSKKTKYITTYGFDLKIRKIFSKTVFSKLLHRSILGLYTIVSFALVQFGANPKIILDAQPKKSHIAVCSHGGFNKADCKARVVTDAATNKPLSTVSYNNGLTPSDLISAYKLPSLPLIGESFNWNGQTVAIVDAYDNPKAASDLLAYRQQFNLPLCPTNASSPSVSDLTSCLFTKLNQNGQPSPLPVGNIGWGQEINLDIDAAMATCAECKILLIEANSAYFSDLGTAVDTAAQKGANAISNSYGGGEFSVETSASYGGHYNHPGIAVTVSSGDSGYGVSFPAASSFVTAVGGTSLTKNSASSRGWSEQAWNGSGSGCSYYVTRPAWQTAIGSCGKRMIADISAVADPLTGLAVYDSYGSSGNSNWFVFGGTSLSSPIIASIYALAGNSGGQSPQIKYGEFLYAHTSNLFDIKSGSNGVCTSKRNTANAALCTSVTGYDGPTGLGTPNGTAAF